MTATVNKDILAQGTITGRYVIYMNNALCKYNSYIKFKNYR